MFTVVGNFHLICIAFELRFVCARKPIGNVNAFSGPQRKIKGSKDKQIRLPSLEC